MKKILIPILSCLMIMGCYHHTFYLEQKEPYNVVATAKSTNGNVDVVCERYSCNDEVDRIPVVCTFDNKQYSVEKPFTTAARVVFFSETTGDLLYAADKIASLKLYPGDSYSKELRLNAKELRKHCGYNLERCLMLVDIDPAAL